MDSETKKEVEKGVEKRLKKGLKTPSNNSILTNIEKEVLHLLTDEFLTIKKIAQRRNVSLQATYKIINKLKKKGAFNGGLKKVENFQSTFHPNDIRLHGQEFNIKIIYQDNKYQELLEKSNILFIDGNSVRLYKNSIEIYSGQSFFGKTINDVENNSLDYWKKFLSRLEHDLKVILVKQRSRNIKIVNQHYARGDSELCENALKNRKRVWVYAEEDGKLAFITDDSFGFKEDETLHPITAKKDRGAIDKQVNDWRINNPPTNSELSTNINQLIQIQTAEATKWGEYAKHIESHTLAIKELSKGIKKLTRIYGNVIKENKRLKLGNQKTIWDFNK